MQIKDLMTPHEKAQLMRLIEKLPTTTKCTDCINYDCGACKLADEMIPKDVLPVGCEQWEFSPDSIPF